MKRPHSLEILNTPPQRWNWPDGGELWRYRFFLLMLIQRELQIRYKQTLLGVGWALLTPLLTIAVFSLVFRGIARVPSAGIPYPLFVLAALIPWGMFASGLTYSATSIVSNRDLMTRLYFPRLLAPLAKQFAGLLDALIALGVLLLLMAAYGYYPGLRMAFLPLLTLLGLATSLGVGLWLAALHVRFRDIGPSVPFLVQLWLYLSPVAYSSQWVGRQWQLWYHLNPMATVCEGFRWVLLGSGQLEGRAVLLSSMVAGVLLLSGMLFFQSREGGFPDEL
jgi:lipopolysaccharide transport system permease protein